MIKFDEALRIVLDNAQPTEEAERVSISDSLGRVLAEDIYAKDDLPWFDNSAMDGYALRSLDTKGAFLEDPKVLNVIEDLKAGYIASKEIKPGTAVRIMTGAPIPEGADSVIKVEETEKQMSDVRCQMSEKTKNPENVKIFREVKSGENVRRAGEDVKKGELVIQKGKLIRPAEIGMLAALGINEVMVRRRAKVAILATGDEVVEKEEDLAPGKIRNSNSYYLCAQVLKCGGQPQDLGIARDDRDETERKIKIGLDSDMVLISGGVSVGDYDFVKDVLTKLGMEMKFWKVAMRPGKPVVFGTISAKGGSASGGKDKPVFGLPGNPVSSMLSFEVFVRPAILKMLGQSQDNRKEVDAVLEENLKKKKGIRYFLRARTEWKGGEYRTKTTGPQGSGILKSMVLANSLIVLPESEELIEKGTRVTVKFLD